MWIDETTFKTSNGSKINLRFNHTLDYEIWKAKGAKSRTEDLKPHPLIGKKFQNIERKPISENDKYGNIGTVEKVLKDFVGGWYIRIIVNYNGSHGVYAWENINSISDVIQKNIEECHNKLIPIGE